MTPTKEPAPNAASEVADGPIKAPAPTKPKGDYTLTYFFLVVASLGLVAIGVIYFFGVLPRQAAKADLDREQKLNTQRTVVYATVKSSATKSELPLPGTIEAFQQSSIFARTNGYVKRWLVDIGQVVREGDLLAELDTPEVDQELNQAKATVEQAKASLAIAQSSADRWNQMVAAHAVSQQEADQRNATRDEAKATLDADEANVQRLSALQNFKQIRAPFPGTITFRNIEVGNLVNAGSGTGASGVNASAQELFRIAQTDPLRIYVDVPENRSPYIKPGVEALIHVSSYPNREFRGKVVRNAGALDPNSRTLRTEIQVANPDGALLPGSYTEVKLQIVDQKPAVLIPANTLIVNAAGTAVARLEKEGDHDIVHLMPVKVGRDFGTEVEILSNLQAGDRLVTNPSADLNEGMSVVSKPLPTPAPTPAPGSQPLVPKS